MAVASQRAVRGVCPGGIVGAGAEQPPTSGTMTESVAGPRVGAPAVAEPEQEEATDVADSLSPLWRVVCHDDPVTTMDFVVSVLQEVFRLPFPRAFDLMMRVHRTGSAVIGRYPESTAKERAERARGKARAAGFPLTFTVERDD